MARTLDEAQSTDPVLYVDRKQLSQLHKEMFGIAISPRTFERWPLKWKIINGRAATPRDEAIAEARRRIDAAPTLQGGEKRAA